MSENISATGSQKKQILLKENRRRISFLLKLVLLVVVIYANVRYDDWVKLINREEWGLAETSENIFKALLFILAANLLISLVRIIVVALYIRQKNDRSRESNVVLAINRITTLLNLLVIVVGGFLLFGLTWGDFFGTFSLVAVATVLLTKDYISNAVNGLINMMSDRLALGDYVKIGAQEGKVIDITLSSVYLENQEGYNISVPNNTVFAADIINYSYKQGKLIEIPVEVRPETLAELGDWEMKLRESLRPYESQLVAADTQIYIQNILIDKVQIIVQFRVKSVDTNLKKQLTHNILQQFAAAKVHT